MIKTWLIILILNVSLLFLDCLGIRIELCKLINLQVLDKSAYRITSSNSVRCQTRRRLSMSQTNIEKGNHENKIFCHSSSNKPLALVQPVIRDYHSIPKSIENIRQIQLQKSFSLTKPNSTSSMNQQRQSTHLTYTHR